jgi:hypothetical protein
MILIKIYVALFLLLCLLGLIRIVGTIACAVVHYKTPWPLLDGAMVALAVVLFFPIILLWECAKRA